MPEVNASFVQLLSALWRSLGAKADREASTLAQGLDARLAALEASLSDREQARRLEAIERSQKQISDLVQGMGARLGALAETVATSERHFALTGQRVEAAGQQIAGLRADLARLDGALAELANAPAGIEVGPARGMVDLVADLRGEVAHLFRPSANEAGAGVVVDGLDVEIRGDLAFGEAVGIRPFAPGRAGPEAASTIRFSLRPQVHIVPPPPDDSPPPAPKKSPRKKT